MTCNNVWSWNNPRSVCVRTAPGNVNMVAYGKINTRLSPAVPHAELGRRWSKYPTMSQLAFPGPRRSTGHWTKASCRWKSIPDLVNTPVKQTIVIWKPVTLAQWQSQQWLDSMSESLNGFTNVLNGTGQRRKQTCPGKSSLAIDKENSAN